MVKPPSPQRAIVCRPGNANCVPNALGAALAMEAQENEPKSRRFLPPLMCLASHMQAVPVSAKNIASSDSQLAQRGGQEFRADGLDPGPFHDVVLQKLVERFRFRDVFLEKAAVRLVIHQLAASAADGGLDVSDEPEVKGRPAADVLGIFVDLDFLHAVAGQELGEREVGAQEQQEVGPVNGVISSAVAEQAGHADGMGIVMFQPLLAAEGISDRGLELARELEHLLAAILTAVAAEDGDLLRLVDHRRQLD